MKKKIIIVYHSQSGKTEFIAETCFEAMIQQQEVEVYFKKALGTTLDDIVRCDAVLFLTPEYFGTMSGALKDFFDRTYYPAIEAKVSLPFALIVCCENEGEGTICGVEKIAKGYGLRKTVDALVIKEHELESRKSAIIEFVQGYALGVTMEVF
jgi:multimeric flavodoxin WrbA